MSSELQILQDKRKRRAADIVVLEKAIKSVGNPQDEEGRRELKNLETRRDRYAFEITDIDKRIAVISK